MAVSAAQASALERCLAQGGVAVFPADTVYGLACDPENAAAVGRLYEIKGRPPDRPAAVMFFSVERALEAVGGLAADEEHAARALLPGPVTLLLPNRRERYPLACAPDTTTAGLRVPALPPALAALGGVSRPLLQSSANPSGGADARRLGDVDAAIRAAADLVLDGGELPGVASTVIDLRRLHDHCEWRVLRAGALPEEAVADALAGQ
jgi:L-threonylcarbamoyladenylate synthase